MPNVHAVRARFGFMETPDVSEALRGARQRGLRLVESDCTFFLGGTSSGRCRGRASRAGAHTCSRTCNAAARRRAEFFRMPTRRVVVLATEIEI
jgi:K+ transporter